MEQGSIQEPRQKAWEMMDMGIVNLVVQIQNTIFHHIIIAVQLKESATMNQAFPIIGGFARLILTIRILLAV